MTARSSAIAGAVGVVALVILISTGAAAPRGAEGQAAKGALVPSSVEGCPTKPTPRVARDMPADVCIPDGFPGIALDYFDDYSWRAFLALVWPAAPGQRGVAASSKGIATPGPRVFETYKPLWEIFHADGSAPARAFNSYDVAAANPCRVAARFGDVTIGSASGIDDIGQAGIGVLDPPIVAQNGRYVRTLTLFNKIAFDHIVQNRFYLRDALPEVPSPRPDRPVMDFPDGSIAIKSAWIDVTDLPPALVKRLYTRTALVRRAAGSGCARVTVGLIGFHIAQKTPSRPQWIWSSFEQADVVPPKWADWPGAFTLNDNTGAPMPEQNPLSLVPLAPEPVRPYNVVRAAEAPILTATELTSYAYRNRLAGTPWQYYKLIVTQWPRLEGNLGRSHPRERGRQHREHVSRDGRVLGVRECDDGDVQSERGAAGVHELPQSRAHERGLHVDRAGSCLSQTTGARCIITALTKMESRSESRKSHRSRTRCA
jgi:hypothetical protein